jgi:hypothetical protein
MTALPINPTDEDIRAWARSFPPAGTTYELVRAAHQAGVEAERARAAAEATEEWGVAPTGKLHRGEPSRSHDAAVRGAARTNSRRAGGGLVMLVRRTVGPWEVAK